LGAYQTWANNEIAGAYSEITALDLGTEANAATQAVAINALSANINAFQYYANTKIGTNNNSNLVVTSTTDSVSAITGALVVAGGVGVGGNLYVTGNIYASNLTAISISTLSVQDPLLYLTANTPFPYNYDIGFFSHYSTTSGFEQHTGLARDYTNGIWGFFSNLYANPGATVDWTEANLIYDTVRVGDLVASNVTPSTSTTTGALRVAGGAGIAGELYINNTGDVSANIGSIRNQLDTLDANVGSYQAYANVYLGVSTTFTVTNSGASAYIINSESNPSLYLIRGQRYNFSINASGHPFWIKTAPSIGVGDQYNTGVFNNGEDNGLITFDVSLTAPDVLYYICQYHSGMVGQLLIVNFATIDANIGTLFLGNTSTQANLGAFQTYANTSFATLDANIGTLFLGNTSTNANLGAFQTYANSSFATLDANIGTLFLGNTSTQANLGAFQTYANATFTTYSNANVTAYLPIHTGNISAGNIDVTGKAAVGTVYTTNGVYWSGNGNPYSTGGGCGGGITYTASTTPPVSPAIADQWYDTAEGILYEYIDDGDTDQWVDIISPTFSGASPVAFNSNVTVTGNIYIGDGIFWTVNGAPYASGGGGSFSGEDTVLRANVGAYQIYANANIGTLYLGNISTQANLGAYQTWANARIQTLDANLGILHLGNISTNANLGTLFLGNISTQANLGAYQTWANSNFSTGTYSNTNVIAYLTQGANIGSGTTTANLVAAATTTSTNTTTGALVVRGGAGIAGVTIVGGNLVAASGTSSSTKTTGALVVRGGVGVSGDINVNAGSTTTGWTVGGLLQTTATTAATSTTTGAFYVAGGAGIIGNLYVDGNVILASSTGSNVVVDSTTSSTSATTGALVVRGGVGIAGTLTAGGVIDSINTTESTGSTSGSFITDGGAYIAKRLNVAGNIVAVATTTSTGTTTGALVVRGGMGVAGSIYGGGVIIASGNIVAASSQASSSTTTGALVVTGGIGVGGAAYIGGLVRVTNTTSSTNSASGALQVAGGVGISGALNVGTTGTFSSATTSTSTGSGALIITGGVGVGGNVYSSSVYTTNGLFWAGNNQPFGVGLLTPGGSTTQLQFNDGILGGANISFDKTNGNLVISSVTTSTSITTGALVVGGGVGVTGNITVGGVMTGGVGYLLERAIIVAGSPPATVDLNINSAAVTYYQANATAQITANIRGDATTSLNSIMDVGETATFALFLPNDNVGFYVQTLKIDNVTITPVWLGGNTVVSGNPNSIDVYTFSVFKTAGATFKVFATQAKFQHTG
jgi:hypothetical protein